MVALAASNVTATVSVRDRQIFGPPPAKKGVIVELTFGNGTLTYPSGGVPLPAKEQFGFKKEIAFGEIEQPYGNGFFYKYDRTNHKLLIYVQGVTMDSTGASAMDTIGGMAENSGGWSDGIQIAGASTADATYDLGGMIEMKTFVAPASATLRVMFVGS